jgi:hypothetical protein
MLRDPDATKFRGLHLVQDQNGSTLLCGEINAKNGFGAYNGFAPFLYEPARSSWRPGLIIAKDYDEAEFIAGSCGHPAPSATGRGPDAPQRPIHTP